MTMRRSRKKIEYLLRRIGQWLNEADNEEDRDRLRRLYGNVKGLEASMEIDFEELTQMLIRNSAFPGDMVGWLDDDFTYDDKDDDSDKDESDEAEV